MVIVQQWQITEKGSESWGGDIPSVKKVGISIPLQSASLSPGFVLSWPLRVVTEICSELGYRVVDGVGGHTEYLRDGIRPESESELESGKVVGKGVPLHLAPFYDVLLKKYLIYY